MRIFTCMSKDVLAKSMDFLLSGGDFDSENTY